MSRNRKGQGMLEYIVVLAAVLLAIIAFSTSGFQTTIRTHVLDGAATELDDAGRAIALQ